MGDRENRQICAGILAHVDAGKTTLAETLAYETKRIRKMGRVDHGDAFLDTFDLEKQRGITIFSKQAEFDFGDLHVTLLDTPGHVDFSAEMERTLQVLDYAILVISGADGVQAHVQTLWELLARYEIPVFLFINKMDQQGTDKEALLDELQEKLSAGITDFTDTKSPDFLENAAMTDESLLEMFLETETLPQEMIDQAILKRHLFPCYFGSALKLNGVDQLIEGMRTHVVCPTYGDVFGGRVFKIARDGGARLTYMKITGGSLKVKSVINGDEKADQIRIYSGAGYETVNEISAGRICAVTGPTSTYAGQGLGSEAKGLEPVLEPVMTYEIILPQGTNVHDMFLKLKELEEEEPLLAIVWDEKHAEIHARVMGMIQLEILQRLIEDRYHIKVVFGEGSIVYRETIADISEGVGHYEPLRHYAEVHLVLEPGERGSGLVFESACSEDVLDKNWQRLIMTHLAEKKHLGVITGSEITDIKITLTAGRAHLKHTEGGDFRQATYRAVRHGLMHAVSVLLEPVYDFTLEIPTDRLGRAMSDIQQMAGTFETPEAVGEMSVIKGRAPVATMRSYAQEVAAYTKGMGRLTLKAGGYERCHNPEEVWEQCGYDPELDFENSPDSVFCSHGAGFVVPWQEVENYMHLPSTLGIKPNLKEKISETESVSVPVRRSYSPSSGIDDEELKQIFERTYGSSKKKGEDTARTIITRSDDQTQRKKQENQEKYLLVDGYNIIFSWDELNDLSKTSLAAARNTLMDILSNYQGFRKDTLILVFDAYKVEGNPGAIYKYHNIHVVFTKEAETADQYIEKTVHRIGNKKDVTVATSDGMEQVIIMGAGAKRMSATDLLVSVKQADSEISEFIAERKELAKNYLFDALPKDLEIPMEEVRLGKRSFKNIRK